MTVVFGCGEFGGRGRKGIGTESAVVKRIAGQFCRIVRSIGVYRWWGGGLNEGRKGRGEEGKGGGSVCAWP